MSKFQLLPEICKANTDDLRDLLEVARADPNTFLIGANFKSVDLRGVDLRGYNLRGASFLGAKTDSATKTDPEFADLISKADGQADFYDRKLATACLPICHDLCEDIVDSISSDIQSYSNLSKITKNYQRSVFRRDSIRLTALHKELRDNTLKVSGLQEINELIRICEDIIEFSKEQLVMMEEVSFSKRGVAERKLRDLHHIDLKAKKVQQLFRFMERLRNGGFRSSGKKINIRKEFERISVQVGGTARGIVADFRGDSTAKVRHSELTLAIYQLMRVFSGANTVLNAFVADEEMNALVNKEIINQTLEREYGAVDCAIFGISGNRDLYRNEFIQYAWARLDRLLKAIGGIAIRLEGLDVGFDDRSAGVVAFPKAH